jgi:hypothetical protein
MLLVVAVATGAAQGTGGSDDAKGVPRPAWEYRVLKKDQVLKRGKKDLAAGLNKLGEDGWELAAVDTVYIFKRLRVRAQQRAEMIKRRIAFLASEVEMLRDRVAWSERMSRKGLMSDQQVRTEQMALKRATLALERARQDLKELAAPKEPAEKGPRPQK